MELTFETELWEWQGQGAWCFLSLPSECYDELKIINIGPKRGFGSLRVKATIGNTSWSTSIFPDNKSSSFLLPVKKDVRTKEHIAVGDSVKTKVKLLEV